MINKENEQKIKVIKLAKKIGFVSKIFADEFKHSNKESLRYYLWLCELMKWATETYNLGDVSINIGETKLEDDALITLTFLNSLHN